ncbi:MAG TPA: hypothetical protein VD967_00895 [Candidatus Paceibacterota bacterium]|nr:hypothetical protein [Candidatus Paceibacterota bacterium]
MNNRTILGIFILLLVAAGGYFLYASDKCRGEKCGDTYTNEMGGTNSGENGGGVHDLPVEPAAAAARADLAARLGIDQKSIVIMKVEERTWSDGCLGLGGDQICTQALVDGFRVEMEAGGKTYVYRTDRTGAAVRAEN